VKASMLLALAGLSISIAHAAEPTGTLMLESRHSNQGRCEDRGADGADGRHRQL
jgi:hypothetical protein